MAPGSHSSPDRGRPAGERHSHLARCSVALLTCAALGLSACASSAKDPPKKRRTTVLMTKYDDIDAGRDAAKSVATETGLYDDPELSAYVAKIGRKLLRGIPRRDFAYQFKVVDEVEPNAFALPGGYIYVSRGLVALTNSEDELACVLGHEITHVALRHAAARQTLGRGQFPLLGMGQRYGKLASYSRDLERSADKGGQILCAAAGYDPAALATFLEALTGSERLRAGFARSPSFFDSHPGSSRRASVNAVRATEMRWRRDPSLGDTRAVLLAQLDGLPVGQRPEAGLFVGDTFLHPALDFRLRFPRGWRTSNSSSTVGARSPRRDAVVFLMNDVPPGEPQDVAETWLSKTRDEQSVTLRKSRPVRIGDIDAWRLEISASSRGGGAASNVTFIPYRDSTWRITGITPQFSEKLFAKTVRTARSFRPMSEEERASIEVTRLRIVKARPGESLVSLGQRTSNAWNVSTTGVYNGLLTTHRFKGGELVKISRTSAFRR